MSFAVCIRKARPSDIDSMTALLADLFAVESDFIVDKDKQKRGLALLLEETGNRCTLVAESNGLVIGMCSAQLLISTSEGGYKALVEDVVVNAEFRRQGISRRLLSTLEEWARAAGAKRLDLMADRNNQGGLEFYKQTHWKSTELIVMQKRISV